MTAKTAAERMAAYRARKRGGPPREPAPCGTRAAAARHRRNSEPLDAACADAERAYMRGRSASRRKDSA